MGEWFDSQKKTNSGLQEFLRERIEGIEGIEGIWLHRRYVARPIGQGPQSHAKNLRRFNRAGIFSALCCLKLQNDDVSFCGLRRAKLYHWVGPDCKRLAK